MAKDIDPTTNLLITPSVKPEEKQADKTEDDSRNDFLNAIVSNVYNPENPATKSDLTPAQIPAMARAYAVADLYDIPVLKKYVEHILVLSFSKNRKSREEFTRVATAVQAPAPTGVDVPTLQNRLFGAVRG